MKELHSENLISKDNEFQEKMHRRLEYTLTNYHAYIRCHEFQDSEKESFMENLKSAIEKELGTFLIEYEFLMMKKEQKGTLKEKFARITELMQKNETYCDIGYIEQVKNELFKNIEKNTLTEKTAITRFIEATEKNIFENEFKAKIDAFQKTPYVYAGNYITFLEYIQKHWLKMDDMRRDKLGKTLEKLKNKNKKVLKQIKKTWKEFKEGKEGLKEDFYQLRADDADYKQQLKGVVGKAKDVYGKVITDLESVGFFGAWLFIMAKGPKEDADKLKSEEIIKKDAEEMKSAEEIITEDAEELKSAEEIITAEDAAKLKVDEFIKKYVIGDRLKVEDAIIGAKKKVEEAQKILEEKVNEKQMKEQNNAGN